MQTILSESAAPLSVLENEDFGDISETNEASDIGTQLERFQSSIAQHVQTAVIIHWQSRRCHVMLYFWVFPDFGKPVITPTPWKD
jgi:hypothetical protein